MEDKEELEIESTDPREWDTPSNTHLRALISGLCQEVAQLWVKTIRLEKSVDEIKRDKDR